MNIGVAKVLQTEKFEEMANSGLICTAKPYENKAKPWLPRLSFIFLRSKESY